MLFILNAEKHIRPSEADCEKLKEQFVEEAMLVLAEREPSLQFLRPYLKEHITHDLSKIMELATVLTPLGIVPENQTTTAGTIEILRQCAPYYNREGVSFNGVEAASRAIVSLEHENRLQLGSFK